MLIRLDRDRDQDRQTEPAYSESERGRAGRDMRSQKAEIIDLEETVKRITSDQISSEPRKHLKDISQSKQFPFHNDNGPKSRIPIPVRKNLDKTDSPPMFKQPNLEDIGKDSIFFYLI